MAADASRVPFTYRRTKPSLSAVKATWYKPFFTAVVVPVTLTMDAVMVSATEAVN